MDQVLFYNFQKAAKRVGGLLVLLLLSATLAAAQENGSQTLPVAISKTIFPVYQSAQKAPKRKLLDLQSAKLSTKLNPLTYLAAGLMFTYQNVISEHISANCSYEISCSEMTKKSIEYHGLIKGTLIGLHQLTNCSPGARYDHCEHAVSSENKILNRIE